MSKPRQVRMYEQIEEHGKKLLAIFPNATEKDPVALCKKLRHLERAAPRKAEDYCNGLMESWEEESDKFLAELTRLLGSNEGIFINGDPRGYALKIDDAYVREHKLDIYRDWGGYGIIAPEFDGN